MKTLLGIAVLVFGAAGAARGQEPVPSCETGCNVATAFSGSAPAPDSFAAPAPSNFGLRSSTIIGATTAAVEAEPEAAPSPAPQPRFVFGGRDDFRWQLGIGADWIRFRSSIFNASAVGIKSSVTYFTNEWFAIEGNVSAAFAPQIFDREHVKVLVYGAGPKIAWRERRWEPWAHGIVGGSHEQPQTAGHSKNAFAAELGGGVDYRFNPRFSGRLEANWIHTSFFSQSQNNFELMGGVVFHF
jgi:opacity protein-like surface antigen